MRFQLLRGMAVVPAKLLAEDVPQLETLTRTSAERTRIDYPSGGLQRETKKNWLPSCPRPVGCKIGSGVPQYQTWVRKGMDDMASEAPGTVFRFFFPPATSPARASKLSKHHTCRR